MIDKIFIFSIKDKNLKMKYSINEAQSSTEVEEIEIIDLTSEESKENNDKKNEIKESFVGTQLLKTLVNFLISSVYKTSEISMTLIALDMGHGRRVGWGIGADDPPKKKKRTV